MTRLRKLFIGSMAALAFVLAVVGGVSAQVPPPGDMMAEANGRYQRGEYFEAVQQYEALLDLGYRDAAVYFNLGNAYLENDDLGRAILNYLRAEELFPRDPDIQANLDLARSKTVDQIEAERDSLIESASYLGRRWITPGELGAVSLLLWVVSGLAIGALIVWRAMPLRAVLRTSAIVSLAVTVVSFLLLLSMLYANPYDNTGVVTEESVEAVVGPGPQYAKAFSLHSGAQVRLVDSRQGWQKVALPGGELKGWVPSHVIEAVGRGTGWSITAMR